MNRNIRQAAWSAAVAVFASLSLLMMIAPAAAHPTSGGNPGGVHPITMPGPAFPKNEVQDRSGGSWPGMTPDQGRSRVDQSINRPSNPGYPAFYQPWVGWGPGSYAWWNMQNCILSYENQPGWWMGDPSQLFLGDTFNNSGLPLGCLAPSGYGPGMPAMPFGSPYPGAFNPFAPFPF